MSVKKLSIKKLKKVKGGYTVAQEQAGILAAMEQVGPCSITYAF